MFTKTCVLCLSLRKDALWIIRSLSLWNGVLYLDKDSLLNFCGYKKSHPLEEYITLYIGFNPKNNIYGQSEELKLNSLIKFMDEICEDLISMYRDIGKEAMKSL